MKKIIDGENKDGEARCLSDNDDDDVYIDIIRLRHRV